MTKYLRDILDQPDQLLNSIDYNFGEGSAQMKTSAGLVRRADHVYISAIGASWNAGIALQAALNETGVQAELCDAADFLHFTHILPDSAVIFLSRSGKSIEIVNALPKCRAAKASVVSITNDNESALARGSDACILMGVRFDNSISVSTYSSIILNGNILARCIADHRLDNSMVEELTSSIIQVRQRISEWKDMTEASGWGGKNPYTYFLARGANLASAHESRLLWEEAAKHPATSLTTGAFRHGPQEIINNSLNIALWLDNRIVRDYDIQLVNDLAERDVNIVSIGHDLPATLKGFKIEVPHFPSMLAPVVNIIPMQLAAEKLARLRGQDPDGFLYCNFIVEAEGGL
ncbi:SIS domain-containing protein [Flavihumibacter solisilvae]|uniref:Glutamine--fructose-6-phosphate aminotransferase [isomerizing] n=1 Tax=Flavihumibacter solisilvae TaxID=1349421 RepID=A0A0C1LAZ0_9BACT|nr:SIS domain-containing protein [Flavihumibacter solisilvae]KIC92693.1 hypothetical protein OI18_21465 [Flavihumibacter solisilvae]